MFPNWCLTDYDKSLYIINAISSASPGNTYARNAVQREGAFWLTWIPKHIGSEKLPDLTPALAQLKLWFPLMF